MVKKTDGDINLEKLIAMAHEIADPYIQVTESWKKCCKLLSILLVISLLSNVYLYVKGHTIIFGADYNVESDIEQTNNG